MVWVLFVDAENPCVSRQCATEHRPNADNGEVRRRSWGLLAGVGGDGSVGAVAECSRGTHSGPRCPDWEQGMGAAMSWGLGGRGGKPRDSLQCAGSSVGEVMVRFRPQAVLRLHEASVGYRLMRVIDSANSPMENGGRSPRPYLNNGTQATFRLRRIKPSPARPRPSKNSDAGSGICPSFCRLNVDVE